MTSMRLFSPCGGKLAGGFLSRSGVVRLTEEVQKLVAAAVIFL